MFVLGLICDGWLWVHFIQAARAQRLAGPGLLKVGPSPWGLRQLGQATALLLLVFVGGNGLAAAATKLAGLEQDAAIPWLLVADLMLRVGILAGVVLYLRRLRMDWQQAFGLRTRSPFAAAAWGGILYLAALPPLAVVFVLYKMFCGLVGIEDTPQPVAELFATTDSTFVVVTLGVFAVAVAPLFEEAFFRGFAHPIIKQRWGTWAALLIVSVVFAAIHFHLPSAGPLFVLAIALGLAYELTGSLWTPIVMHALFNSTNIVFLMYARLMS